MSFLGDRRNMEALRLKMIAVSQIVENYLLSLYVLLRRVF